MSPEFQPGFYLSGKDDKTSEVDLDVIVQRLQNLGLKTNSHTLKQVNFAKFEINENNSHVEIEVGRPDGSLTRCYLARNMNSIGVHLQVSTKIVPGDKNYGTEVHGIFPSNIVAVMSTGHIGSHSYDALTFVTENGGSIGVKDDGSIELEQEESFSHFL